MRAISFKRLAFLILAILALQSSFTSCKKDDDNSTPSTPAPAAYPKTVTIEYNLVSESGVDTVSSIAYTNETAGTSSVTNIKLPYSKKLTRTVNRYDNVGFGFTTYGVGTLRVKILVDGKVVKEQAFSGTTVISGTVPYVFP